MRRRVEGGGVVVVRGAGRGKSRSVPYVNDALLSRAPQQNAPTSFQPHTTYHCRANCSGLRGRQTEMTTQKASESRPTKTAPGCLHKRDDHRLEPLPPFLAFLRDAIAAGGGTLLLLPLGRAITLWLLQVLWAWAW